MMASLRIPEMRYVLPITAAWAFAVVVMVAEKDLGSALLFFTLFTVMMWVATERAVFMVLGVFLFSIAAYVAWRMFDVVQTRVDIWIDPWSQYEGKGYQPAQDTWEPVEHLRAGRRGLLRDWAKRQTTD